VPRIDHKDLGLLGLLPILAALAFATPERVWPALTDRLAGVRLALRGGRAAAEVARIEAVVGTRPLGRSPAECWRGHLAHNYLAWMQLLRCYHPHGWPAAVHLEGRAEIDQTLRQGRGGILWVAQLAFSDLATKRALHQAGYAVSHLSRDTHGFSETRFGRRWLNPIKTNIERRYVAERLVMTDGNTVGALRELTLRLKQNRLVSITVAPTGQQTRLAPFLDGRLRVATGALALAWQTGAPVLPVFTLRAPDGGFATRVEPALLADRRLDRTAAIDAMLAAYGTLLEAYVLRCPDQFPLAYIAIDREAADPQ
jgi:lauroyl/myristoyl acyltransferase